MAAPQVLQDDVKEEGGRNQAQTSTQAPADSRWQKSSRFTNKLKAGHIPGVGAVSNIGLLDFHRNYNTLRAKVSPSRKWQL